MGEITEAALKARVADYKHKAQVLRAIHSQKLKKSQFWNGALNYCTVVVSTIVTFLAFLGVKNVHQLFLSNFMSLNLLEFYFNFVILLLLIASFLQITLHLGEEALTHLASVRALTNFITSLDDIALQTNLGSDVCQHYIERLNSRYEMINSILEANSDREWRKAKALLSRPT